MSLALFQNDSHETGSEGRACAQRPSGSTSRLAALLYDYCRVRADPPANLFILRGFARQVGPREDRPSCDRQPEKDIGLALKKVCRILEIYALILWSFLIVESSGEDLFKSTATWLFQFKVGRFVFQGNNMVDCCLIVFCINDVYNYVIKSFILLKKNNYSHMYRIKNFQLTFVKFTNFCRFPVIKIYRDLYVETCIWSSTVNETCKWVHPSLYLWSCSSFVTVHAYLCESFCHVPATLMRQPICWAELCARFLSTFVICAVQVHHLELQKVLRSSFHR